MIKRLCIVIGIIQISFLSMLKAQVVENTSLGLLPWPASLVVGEGNFTFTEKTVIAIEDKAVRTVVEDFVELFSKASGFAPRIKAGSKKGDVCIRKDDTLPAEHYLLEVNSEKVIIKASEVKGVFYALQTIRQLLPPEIEGGGGGQVAWMIPVVTIADEPRLGYRGLMVDVARYFIAKEHLLRIIDCMGMLKLNKLHLHLTDDNGWRLEIKQYPLLTQIGSKTVQRAGLNFPERRNARQGEPLMEGGFYTQEDIREIVAYAASRQIEVIPEIAMPRHSNAALAAYPMLVCPIVDKYIGAVPGLGGNLTQIAYCVGNEDVFTFLQNIVDEVLALFPSPYIHLGGDAVHDTPWQNCPLCKERMRKEDVDGEKGLFGYFMRRMDSYVRSKGRKVMGWEEVMDANLSRGAVVFDWHGYGHGAVKAGKHGHDFIVTPTGKMYLNGYQGPQWHEPVLSFGVTNTLKNVYDYEPIERYWTMSMRSHLLGVQASLWTEFCEKPEDVDFLLFPRLAAVAEIAWTSPTEKRWDRFLMTLDDYQERWRIKGIQPSLSMYNVGHEVTPNFGGLKVSLNCIRPDVEIRYTVDGTEPNRYASLYRRPWIVKKTQVIKCATFKDGEQMGQTLVLPIRMNPVTGRNLLRSNPIERRMVNGVRGSLKCTDGEWASWAKNDSIVLTFDVGSRKGLQHLLLGCLNNYGLGIHKPKKIEVWLSDNDVAFWKVADKHYSTDEIFREGRFVEDLDFKFEGTARYVRLVMKGIGKCPSYHVRPGMEARIFLDEVVIE